MARWSSRNTLAHSVLDLSLATLTYIGNKHGLCQISRGFLPSDFTLELGNVCFSRMKAVILLMAAVGVTTGWAGELLVEQVPAAADRWEKFETEFGITVTRGDW